MAVCFKHSNNKLSSKFVSRITHSRISGNRLAPKNEEPAARPFLPFS